MRVGPLLPAAMPLLLLLAATALLPVASAANILAMLTIASPSHHIWHRPLLAELAARGHNLTVLSPKARHPPLPNFTDLVIEGLSEHVNEQFDFEEMTELTARQWMDEGYTYYSLGCDLALKSDALARLLAYPENTTFDLVIIEAVGTECLLSVLSRFGDPPVIATNAFGVPPWVLELTGTPNLPSFMPQFMLQYSDDMTLFQVVHNLLLNAYTYYTYHYMHLPAMDRLAAERFGPSAPPSWHALQRVGLVLTNFHPAFDFSWPVSPTLIPVAGVHIEEPRPLPADIQRFLDGAADGAVLLSLGTNVRSDRLGAGPLQAVVRALAALPRLRVLWKFESRPPPPGLPPSVRVSPWLPQGDVLAHPNVKLFISHCGMLSTQEAIHRGVPVLGIPFMVDQPVNAFRLQHMGAGRVLKFRDLTAEALVSAITDIVNNGSYAERMRELSARFRAAPESPLRRAAFWAEQALRGRGPGPPPPPAWRRLPWARLLLLDALALLLLPPALLLVAAALCCRRYRSAAPAPGRLKSKKQ